MWTIKQPSKIIFGKNSVNEFSFPENQYSLNQTYWKPMWLESLKKVGIIKSDNVLKSFSIVSETRGMITKYEIEHMRNLYESKIVREKGSNIIIPSFNFGPENINRVVPQVILNTVKALTSLTGNSK